MCTIASLPSGPTRLTVSPSSMSMAKVDQGPRTVLRGLAYSCRSLSHLSTCTATVLRTACYTFLAFTTCLC